MCQCQCVPQLDRTHARLPNALCMQWKHVSGRDYIQPGSRAPSSRHSPLCMGLHAGEASRAAGIVRAPLHHHFFRPSNPRLSCIRSYQ